MAKALVPKRQFGNERGAPCPELDPRKVWHEALTKEKVEPGMIIATADFLFETGNNKHAAEFLKANLRQGTVARPWVYEALAVALEASNGDPAEVRRARLSAVALDPQDTLGFLEAARTLAEHKDWDRAVAFCRQAAQLEPNLAQPYVQALAYAERSKDSQAMEWAAGKILSQDWPADNDNRHLQAQAQMELLAQVLEKEKRPAEADRLLAQLEKLRYRDMVITLTWENGSSGSANLDLIVQEPGGSVCSLEQRQTPGGGILIGNTLADMKRTSYLAAQAFPGEYQITVRRNWGQTFGKRARVEIIQHLGTPQETRQLAILHQQPPQTSTVTVSSGARTALAMPPAPTVPHAKPKEVP